MGQVSRLFLREKSVSCSQKKLYWNKNVFSVTINAGKQYIDISRQMKEWQHNSLLNIGNHVYGKFAITKATTKSTSKE